MNKVCSIYEHHNIPLSINFHFLSICLNSHDEGLSLCHKLWFSNPYIFRTRQILLKYQRFTSSGCRDNGIRKFVFVPKVQFLSSLIVPCNIQFPISSGYFSTSSFLYFTYPSSFIFLFLPIYTHCTGLHTKDGTLFAKSLSRPFKGQRHSLTFRLLSLTS